ncbi:hypothetical protein BVC80_1543g301 [Macleaya cordata]|uniref:Uncharacterized protein n=1 Tax=Macleaya cordata TaxID=56857 RepID=A0A200R2E0_MACCD|nr:hypothetical protein BVC80_1543g301 [Macleaya cordata]
MASEKEDIKISDTHASSNQEITTERSPNKEATRQSHLGRAIAQRALYGSNRRRIGSRKVVKNDARSLSSRLSKVSFADN